MADRYWVGTGVWNSGNTANWSDTSGGATGVSVPTLADNVIFDASSGNCDLAAGGRLCRSLDASTYTGAMVFSSGGTATLSVGDSVPGPGNAAFRLSAAMTFTTGSGSFPSTITFASTSTTVQTITTAGKTLGNVTFNGVGGKWTLQDALTCSGFTVTNGHFDSNNQSIAAGGFNTGVGTKTITLGSSTFTIAAGGNAMSHQPTNQTITANTATFIISSASGLGVTTDFNGASLDVRSGTGFTLNGGTWKNLTRTVNSRFGLQPSGDTVVTGTLTITGEDSTLNRCLVASFTLGTPRVITADATALTDVDFMDISIVGPVGSTITSDSFNRADGALGTTDAAAGGSPIAWGSSVDISSNRVGPTSNSSSVAWLDVGVSDLSVNTTVTTLPSSGHGGLVVRHGSNLGTLVQFVVSNAATPARLQCTVGYVSYADLTMGLVAAGSTLELRVIGSAAVALVNGVVVGAINLPSVLPASTKVGLIFQPAATFDDFVVKNLSPVTGTRLGDCLGNSGITFTTASGTARDGGGPGVKRYAVAAGNWSSTATWSETDGGAAGASVPLPQDDVYLTASSGAGTYTVDKPRLGRNIDFTGFTRTGTINVTASFYGNITLGSGTLFSGGAGGWWGQGRGSHTVTCNGASFNRGFNVNTPTGTYTCQDNLNVTSTGGANFGLTRGTFSDAGFSVYLNGTLTGQMSMTGGTLNATGTWHSGLVSATAIWQVTGGTVNASSMTFVVDNASTNDRTFAGGGFTYGTLTYTVADSPGALTITGANTFGTLNIGSGRSLKLPTNTQTNVGTLNVAGVARGGVRFGGDFASFLSVPDSAALSALTDMDFRIRVQLAAWSPPPSYVPLLSKGTGVAAGFEFHIYVTASGAVMVELGDGSGVSTQSGSSVATGITNGLSAWLRITRRSSDGRVQHFKAEDSSTMPVAWTKIGTDLTNTRVLPDTSGIMAIGSLRPTDSGGFKTMRRVQIRNNVLDDGTGIVFDTDFSPSRFDPYFLDSANGAIVTPAITLANVGDGRVVIESATAGMSASLNVTNPYQLEGVDLKDVTINGDVTLGAQSVIRSNVKGVKRSPRRQGLMVGA